LADLRHFLVDIAIIDLLNIKKNAENKNNNSIHILENKKFSKINHNAMMTKTLIITVRKILK